MTPAPGEPEEMVEDLLRAASHGDSKSWERIVDRYAPLVWSVCRRYHMSMDDAADVSQTVWLCLLERLSSIREPRALAAWLITVTSRQCLQVHSTNRRVTVGFTAEWDPPDPAEEIAVDYTIMAQVRRESLLAALAELPSRHRQLMLLLLDDPPRTYQDISELLQIPIGSIGPIRGRCLARLRGSAQLQPFSETTSID